MNKKKFIIAIDGTAGAGKSSLAKELAERTGYLYIDTGAMYRAVAYKVIKSGVDIKDAKKIIDISCKVKISLFRTGKVVLDGEDVTKKIISPEVSEVVSKVAAIKGVRRQMVKRQREMGKKGGVIAEGRDIGTVVFPKADIKFFLIADIKERTKRRYKELREKGIKSNLKDVEYNIVDRDIKDSSRKISPLKPAKDAIIVDTTEFTMKKKNDMIWRIIKQKI